VSIQTGLIVWLNGGVSGATHDLTIAKEGILRKYPDKIFIGDKGYSGHENIVTPFKSPQSEAELQWNKTLGAVRVSVEHTFGRIKSFHCLNTKWRHNILYHPIVFQVITNLVNFDLLFYPIKA